MRRLDELNLTNSCLNKAFDDEPIFILRAKDPIAAAIVRQWCLEAERSGVHEQVKITKARMLASEMNDWRSDFEDGVIHKKRPGLFRRMFGKSD